MSNKRITRTQAQNNDELRGEIEQYNPFAPRKELPRGDEEEEALLNNSMSGSDQENNTVVDLGSYSENSSGDSSNNSCNKPSNKFSSKFNKNKIFKMENQTDNPPVHTPSGQMVTLRDALTIVPEFNGKNIPLGQFIEGCSEAKEMIEPEFEANLVKLIRRKITGEARQSIFGQSFANIEQLKNFL